MAININKDEYVIKDVQGKILIELHGFLKPENIHGFLNDYEQVKKSVDLNNTDLILDGKTLKTFPAEIEDELMKLYKNYTVFRKVYIVTPAAVVTKMQVKRVLKKAGIEEKFEFINDISEAK